MTDLTQLRNLEPLRAHKVALVDHPTQGTNNQSLNEKRPRRMAGPSLSQLLLAEYYALQVLL